LAASEGYRPASQRSQLDRWISSEVALAVREVASELGRYGIYEAAQRLIDLVDALSNWYVRRSRGRFWAAADDAALRQDKLDASYTLYEALVTIVKAIAPFVPFFAEQLYQNLVRGPWPTTQPESVHLCRYPEPDEAVIDEQLAGEMGAVRELVSLGLQVRTAGKLRVRQPLARADIVVSNAELAPRLEGHTALVAEELNVHEVRWLLPGQEGAAVAYQLKPNFRVLGPRLGKKVQQVKQALAKADAGQLRAELAQHGRCSITLDGGEAVALSDEEVQVTVVASEGFAAAGGRAGVVVLHTGLTDELLDEGLAREVLARVQAQRKKLDLGYTERIAVTVRGSERLTRVVAADGDHLMREALCDELQVEVAPAGSEPGGEDGWLLESIQDEQVALRVEPRGAPS
jgi:isoleucyl-tRNA synthetase